MIDTLFLDIIPIVKLDTINYFAQRYNFSHDPHLVLKPRVTQKRDYVFRGDLAVMPHYFEENVTYTRSYTREGFRPNPVGRPYDIAIIGDSFIEFGETDEQTLTWILFSRFGIRTANLGRSWYGPEQYFIMAREHARILGPKCLMIAIFVGNDIKDIDQYRLWKNGGRYYHFRLSEDNVFVRFKMAIGDVRRYIGQVITQQTADRNLKIPEDLGIVEIGRTNYYMRFAYWPRVADTNAYEWRRLDRLLWDFVRLCEYEHIKPAVLLIPTKEQVYARYVMRGSLVYDLFWRFSDSDLRSFQHNIRLMCKSKNIPVIDLVDRFVEEAKSKPLLYWQYDTHWTYDGRLLAASIIADWYNEMFVDETK